MKQDSWFEAVTIADLGHLTAAWLEGRITSQPGYQPGYGPDEETKPLIASLVLANRFGYLTRCSQPGTALTIDSDGATVVQRAAVSGFLEEGRAVCLANAAMRAGFEIVLNPRAIDVRWSNREPYKRWIPVTYRTGKPILSFGGFLNRRAIRRSFGDLCGHAAVEAVSRAAQLTIVDPVYGGRRDLWNFLEHWATSQNSPEIQVPAGRVWGAADASDVDLYVFALGLHLAALNWIRPDFVGCVVPECFAKLRPEHVLDPRFQGHCPDCADRLSFPAMPPF